MVVVMGNLVILAIALLVVVGVLMTMIGRVLRSYLRKRKPS
jgi:hypothetical protein